MAKIAKIIAEFEIVTPMFLGGANHEATRIRESSIKGALAFWWRALNYARFVERAAGQNNQKLDNALEAMQKEEQKLFGGPDGQGAFLLKVSNPSLEKLEKGKRLGADGNHCSANPPNQSRRDAPQQWTNWEKKLVGPGGRYFGYGLMGAAARKAALLDRSCIKAGQSFTVQIMYRDTQDDLIKESLIPTLKLFGLLGGLGSRVRRGWGSVALKSIHEFDKDDKKQEPALWTAPEDIEEYKKAIGDLFKEHPSCNAIGTKWPLTAFASESRIWISDKCGTQNTTQAIWSTGIEALDQLGRALLNYRAWGQNGMVGDQAVQQQFTEDHNWFYNKDPMVKIPHRVAFGLPQNYFKYVKSGKNKSGSVNQGKEGRRASPMFFHIHKIGGDYIGVISLFPTLFITGKVQAKNSVSQSYDGAYSLTDKRGSKTASGLDVLLDFIGREGGKFNKNAVMDFEQIFPANNGGGTS